MTIHDPGLFLRGSIISTLLDAMGEDTLSVKCEEYAMEICEFGSTHAVGGAGSRLQRVFGLPIRFLLSSMS